MPDAIGTKRPRRLRIAAGVLIAILVTVGGVAFARDEIANRLVDPAPTAPADTPSASLTADEQAFYDFVEPRLARVSAEGNALFRLASGRSRNLIELQTRGARVDNGSREIDDYLRSRSTPPRFAGAIRDYQTGITAIRTGMDEARSAFLSFDWDRMASAVEQFDAGATQLTAALDAFHRTSGATLPSIATPSATVV